MSRRVRSVRSNLKIPSMSGNTKAAQALPKAFSLLEIDNVPDNPGVYAWYFKSIITERDIGDFLAELRSTTEQEQREEKVRAFLNLRLFAPLQESPYTVVVQGALKPTYRGNVNHEPTISGNLVERIARNPERLRSLDHALRKTVPHFASPIYIGVATQSLRKRLQSHRNLIRRYRENFGPDDLDLRDDNTTNESRRDHSFAREVVHERRLHPNKLQVYVLETEISAEIALDVENVLNRLNFPLCGRQ